MTSRASLAASCREAGRPRYVPVDAGAQWHAVFPSGKQVAVDTGRSRHYPGLVGVAPCTTSLYRAIAGAVSADTVLDAGAGSGEGAALLERSHSRVIAVERDEQAVAFGRQFAPGVSWSLAELEQPSELEPVDLVCLVDVLTQSRDPAQTLAALGARLSSRGALFVAEARAVPSQRLSSPQRRGFSNSELGALLTRSGLRVERRLKVASEFSSVLAVRDHSRASADLLSALERLANQPAAGYEELGALLERSAREGSSCVATEASLVLADLACKAGEWQRAVAHLEPLVTAWPRDGRVWAALSRVALRRRQPEQAWYLASQATAVDPGCYPANLALALSAHALGRADAVAAWGSVARLTPAEGAPVARLARVAAERGDYKTGIVAFERLMSYSNAPNPEMNSTLGWLLALDGQAHRALQQATQALLLDPDCGSAVELLTSVAGIHPELVADA